MPVHSLRGFVFNDLAHLTQGLLAASMSTERSAQATWLVLQKMMQTQLVNI
jgi:hypothetical protein